MPGEPSDTEPVVEVTDSAPPEDTTDSAPPEDTGPPPPYGETLVADGGFESSLDAWTFPEEAECSLVGALKWLDEAAEGTQFLYSAPDMSDCVISQDIDLSAFPAAAIDAGTLGVFGEIWLGGLLHDSAMDDHIWMAVDFLDASGARLGRVRTRGNTIPEWELRTLDALLPPGTRSLRLSIEGTWRQGSANDGHADGVKLWIEPVEAAETPGVLKQPQLMDYRTDAMIVMWETDSNLARSSVRYGASGGGLTETVVDVETRWITEGRAFHVAELTGLQAETAYDYQVVSGQTASEVLTFRTAPGRESPYTVAWSGDSHQGAEIFSTLSGYMAARQPDLYISVGDVVNLGEGVEEPGQLQEWHEYWFGPREADGFSAQIPTMLARGNHEAHYELSYAYTQLPGNGAWYAFDYGNAHIIVLDSQTALSEPQRQFLNEALYSASAEAAEWLIVTFHKAPYSNATKSGDDGDGTEDLRNNWVPAFEAAGVDLVVSAHFHSYQRGEQDGVVYTIVGGSGGLMDTTLEGVWDLFAVYEHTYHYALMEVEGSTLTWTAYDLKDEVLDSFTLKH